MTLAAIADSAPPAYFYRRDKELPERRNVNLRLESDLFEAFKGRVEASGKSASRAIEEIMRSMLKEER